MATVHIGRLMGPVGFARTVAIKRLHAQFAHDPEFVSMFLDEARLAARIRHPNVVPTLDVVALEGELFLVMEYIQGGSFNRLIKATVQSGRRIPLPYMASVVAGALLGLHAAHEARGERGEPLSIVHRDVSPQNILVGVDGVPRVLDFGVAKAAGRLHSTRQGQLKGKMGYMAPEQLGGHGVDRRTDVYAAGVVLWEALTGQRLFSGENDAEVFGKVLNAERVPPSAVAPEVPPELDAIVMQAIARSPDERFATAREMARALETSVPLVSATDIGEWVEATLADALAVRAQRIARIENDSSTSLSKIPHAAWPQEAAPSHGIDRPSSPAPREGTHGGLASAGGTGSAVRSVMPGPRRSRVWLFGAILALAGAIVLARFLLAPAAVPTGLIVSSPARPPEAPSGNAAAVAPTSTAVAPGTGTERPMPVSPPAASAAAPRSPPAAPPVTPSRSHGATPARGASSGPRPGDPDLGY
jgi:serine/threonine-protein kinase